MRVKGHTLLDEGKGFARDGERYPWEDMTEHNHGKCSCGLLSPPLYSDAARKRWHKQHKIEVQEKR